MVDFALQESPKLISRKIWMIKKLWNFHTVCLGPHCILSHQCLETINHVCLPIFWHVHWTHGLKLWPGRLEFSYKGRRERPRLTSNSPIGLISSMFVEPLAKLTSIFRSWYDIWSTVLTSASLGMLKLQSNPPNHWLRPTIVRIIWNEAASSKALLVCADKFR